jgi:hypothetical protein
MVIVADRKRVCEKGSIGGILQKFHFEEILIIPLRDCPHSP